MVVFLWGVGFLTLDNNTEVGLTTGFSILQSVGESGIAVDVHVALGGGVNEAARRKREGRARSVESPCRNIR
jgi:hypothetical protein